MRNLIDMWLDLLREAQALPASATISFARLEAVHAMHRQNALQQIGIRHAFDEVRLLQGHLAKLIQHIDLRQVVALAHFEVIEVMGRR